MSINNKLVAACERGNLSAAKKYIEQGADIHAWNDYTLYCAASRGHFDVVKCLVEHGANIHVYNDEALRCAASYGHLQTMNVIRKAAGAKYKCHRCIIRSTCLELCKDFRNGH